MRWVRCFLFPGIVLLAHTGLVVFVWICVRTSDDPETGMLWGLFAVIDWPASLALFSADNGGPGFILGLVILGGLQWSLITLIGERMLEVLSNRTTR
jgi:hypothetical protein